MLHCFIYRVRKEGSAVMASDIILTNPDTMAQPGGHYTHAVTANGFVFIAGQLPIAPDGNKLVDATFEHQAQQVLDNVAVALKGAGSAVSRLVQVRVYVTDIKQWPAFNAIYAKWIGSSRSSQCRNCILTSRSKSRLWHWRGWREKRL